MPKFNPNINKVLQTLRDMYPGVKPSLNFSNPYQTLVATILSAQSTDKQVNKVTPAVFRDFPTVYDMANTTPDILYPYVKSCGFKSKASNLVMAAKIIVEEFDGEVPRTYEEIMTLPGVGIKTADVVLSHAFGVPAIAVDTHVFRVSNRLKLADANTVEKTREQLMENIPKEEWSSMHLKIIHHGRELCKARNPLCSSCALKDICPHYLENNGGN